tara:strand:- start:1210 stop:1911 length:702 start_codon:yes stop_codon:yes gene_type:complete
MANSKIMERVRKLLAMAKDATSPNEAAIAARRARSLMDKHQLEEHDIEDISTTAQFGKQTWENPNKNIASWKNYLAVQVAKLNDCEVKGTRVDGNLGVTFQGMAEDVQIAGYMFDYLTTAGEYQYSVFKSAQTGLNRGRYKTQFCDGFSEELRARIKEIIAERKTTTGTGTDLIVLKKQLVDGHFGKVSYTRQKRNTSRYDAGGVNAHSAGVEAGSQQSLHHGVDQTKRDSLR